MSNRKYFGTDGIRGKVGEYPITPEFVLKLGWAVGKVLGSSDRDRIVIGKDTRISGYMFESALESGIIAAGMNVQILGTDADAWHRLLDAHLSRCCGNRNLGIT